MYNKSNNQNNLVKCVLDIMCMLLCRVAALSARVLFLFTKKYLSFEMILSVSLLTFSGKVTDTHFNYTIPLESAYLIRGAVNNNLFVSYADTWINFFCVP